MLYRPEAGRQEEDSPAPRHDSCRRMSARRVFRQSFGPPFDCWLRRFRSHPKEGLLFSRADGLAWSLRLSHLTAQRDCPGSKCDCGDARHQVDPAGLASVVGAARDDSAILEIPGEEHAHRNRKYGEHDDGHRLSKRGEQKRQHAQNRGRNRGGHVQRRKRLRRCVEVDAYGRKKAATNKAAMTMVRAATMVLARAVPAISLFSST